MSFVRLERARWRCGRLLYSTLAYHCCRTWQGNGKISEGASVITSAWGSGDPLTWGKLGSYCIDGSRYTSLKEAPSDSGAKCKHVVWQWGRPGPMLAMTCFMLQSSILLICGCSSTQSNKSSKASFALQRVCRRSKRSIVNSWYGVGGSSLCNEMCLLVKLAAHLGPCILAHSRLWYSKTLWTWHSARGLRVNCTAECLQYYNLARLSRGLEDLRCVDVAAGLQ